MLAPNPQPPSLLKRLTAALAPMPRARPFAEMGASGTAVYSGYVQTRERSSQWTGYQRYVTIADMAVNASIVAAGVHYFLNLIAHPQWSLTPADDSPEAKAAAELVEEVIHDMAMPWSRVVRRAGTFRFYGFGVQEWTAKRRADGRVGLLGIEPRPQHSVERWAVADDGEIEGVFQRAPQTGALLGIPRKKMLYLVDDALTDSPEGVGIFRHLAEPWERLQKYYDLEARVFERDLRGIPIGRVPYTLINNAVKEGTITEARAAALVKAMEDFVKLQSKKSDTAITLDSLPYYSEAADGNKVAGLPQWGLELLQGSSNGVAELAGAISRTQMEMARVLTCEHLMLGGDSTGNRALSEDKSRNLYLVANAVLEDIAMGVTHDVVPNVCLLNGIPEELYPWCSVEDVAFKDAESVAGTLAKMAQAGATLSPDDPVVADVRELMGVSAPAPVSPELAGLPSEPPTDEELGDEEEPAPEDDGEEEEVEKADQPRVPAGSPEGGLFASTGGGSSGSGGGGGSGGGSGDAAEFNRLAATGKQRGFGGDKKGAIAFARRAREVGFPGTKVFQSEQVIVEASRGRYAGQIGGGGARTSRTYFVQVRKAAPHNLLDEEVVKADESVFQEWYDEAAEKGYSVDDMLDNLREHEEAALAKADGGTELGVIGELREWLVAR